MPYKDVEKYRQARLRWYYKNKEKVRLYKSKARSDRAEYIKEIKNVPCADCKMRFPAYVMDFDHITSNKSGIIALMAVDLAGWDKLKEEISKCEIVCANCHRIRTYKRRTNSLRKAFED